MFITMQFGRPNDAGIVTGWVALGITILSTLVRISTEFRFNRGFNNSKFKSCECVDRQVHMSPPGKGVLSSTILQHTKTLEEAKEWVWHHARTPQGERISSKSDWEEWLQSPQGQSRPRDIPSEPDKEYSRMSRTYKRRMFWVSWDDFLRGSSNGESAG